ncbi:MAG: hypothetical protein JWM00_342 [Candidatus Saccharibacteria bacterium]|nr:hypothetical protein [Candidatus Saccharibacteria bacterium]
MGNMGSLKYTPAQAVKKLVDLIKEAQEIDEELVLRYPPNIELVQKWQTRAGAAIKKSFFHYDYYLDRLREINYQPSRRPKERRFNDQPSSSIALDKATRILKEAIVDIQLDNIADVPLLQISSETIDPGLWYFVQDELVNEKWDKVTAQTAIYLEHTIRKLTGDPRSHDGKKLTATKLFERVFSKSGEYSLGSERETGEQIGWLNLTTGFALAIGNVDRHNIQNRDDQQKYAIGALGLASLILTQLEYQHSDKLVKPPRPSFGDVLISSENSNLG